jgi:subfamily B ATP-binding cassette protein MsbA
MHFKLPVPVRRLIKATSFWKENYIVLREFKHFRRLAALAIIFTLLSAVFDGFGVGFVLSFLQGFTNPNAAPIQTGVGWFDNWILGINAPVNQRLYRISSLILILTFVRLSFSYLGLLYSRLCELNLGYRLHQRLFEQLQALSLSYFAKTRSGELIHTIKSESAQLVQTLRISFLIITQSLTLLVFLVSMLLLSWQLTIISIMLFSLLSVGISTLLGRIREASFETSKASGNYTSVVLEFINGVRTVQAFAAHEFEQRRFSDANQRLLKAQINSTSAQIVVSPLREGVAITILISMLILSFATLIPNGQMQPASLLTFLFVLFRMMPALRQLDGARVQISSLYGALHNIKEFLRTDNKPYLKDGKLQFLGLQRAIEFVAVDFGYDPDELVLHNISLTIKPGQMMALVGASGAGKSTLVDLIPRFYDPIQGQILIDGVDLRKFDISSLRRKLAVVSQDTFIFNTSVRNNIAYAIDDADEEAIWEAARLANALEFIQQLPQGFDTQLGDRGIRLSGGQRQRIAIARALLRDPEILILDEATSALDSVSERLIQDSLEKLSVGRTVIAIAHRLSTIIRADKVVVLERGRIVEQGEYQELLEQRGNLWKYHQIQHEMGQAS